MSEINRETVIKIARLANIRLQGNEAEAYAGQLEHILEHIHQLNKLDTKGIPETTHAMPISNVWRADQVMPSLDREETLASAPESESGCFRVPRIIE